MDFLALAGEGLGGAHIAQTLLGDLGQGAEILLDAAAEGADGAAVKEGADGDGGEEGGEDGGQGPGDVGHHGQAGGRGNEGTETIGYVLGDAFPDDDGVAAEAGDEVADAVGVEKLGVLDQRAAVKLGTELGHDALSNDAKKEDAAVICAGTESEHAA